MSKPIDVLMKQVEEYLQDTVVDVDAFEYWHEVVVPQDDVELENMSEVEIEEAYCRERDDMLKKNQWLELGDKVYWWDDVIDELENIQKELDHF